MRCLSQSGANGTDHFGFVHRVKMQMLNTILDQTVTKFTGLRDGHHLGPALSFGAGEALCQIRGDRGAAAAGDGLGCCPILAILFFGVIVFVADAVL